MKHARYEEVTGELHNGLKGYLLLRSLSLLSVWRWSGWRLSRCLPVKLNPSRTFTRISPCRSAWAGASARVVEMDGYQQTGGDACPRQRGYKVYLRLPATGGEAVNVGLDKHADAAMLRVLRRPLSSARHGRNCLPEVDYPYYSDGKSRGRAGARGLLSRSQLMRLLHPV